jgi:Lrp/AsnC family transcriptional regulator of ectoine degradation
MKLDAIDIKILAALQRDGRATKTHLGEMVGLSPSPCHERVKRLEEEGLIRSYHADIAIEKIARNSLIFVTLSLAKHETQSFERFQKAIQDIPEILECHKTGGVVDYILKIIAPDITAYQDIMEGLLAADAGIEKYVTHIVTKAVKHSHGYPIEKLMQGTELNSKNN